MSDLQHEINEVIRRVCLLFTLALLLAAAAAAVILTLRKRGTSHE